MGLSYSETRGVARVRPSLRFSAKTAGRASVVVAVVLFIGFWLQRALGSWRDLQTSAYDLAAFDQVIWNSAHGRLFETSFLPYNYVGEHFQPVLLLFVPFYWLGGGAPVLLVAQVLASGIAAVVLYEAARTLRLHPAVSAAAAIAYLLNPYLHRALAFDFHPETMLTLPAFAAFWAFASGHVRLGVGCALAVLLFKEDAVFVALALAVCAATLGHRRPALAVASIAIVSTLIVVGWLMPDARGGHASHLAARYSVLGGHEGLPALAFMLRHPLEGVEVLTQPGGADPGIDFIATAPWLLLAPWHALALVPGLALTLLSSHPPQRALDLHYAVEMVPITALAGLFACQRLVRLLPTPAVTSILIGTTGLAMLALSPASPLASGQTAPVDVAYRRAVADAISLVPPDDAVSAQSNLAPRLAHRKHLWVFPGWWEDADWVLVDERGGRPSDRGDFDATLESVRQDYRLIYEADGISLFQAPRP